MSETEPKKVIYTITSLSITKIKRGNIELDAMEPNRNRLVGYYFDLETAQKCVENDWGAFDEAGYYNTIVIEKVYPGLYNIGAFDEKDAHIQYEWWYRHERKPHSKWVACEKPNFGVSVCNFGIG